MVCTGLTRSQLKRLAEHKYNVGGVSLLEPLIQGFWRWTVERIPIWWAPNAITVAGLIINVATTVILFIYSPDGVAEAPGWSYILCAIGLFIYQTLDAIDGKQARRTNSSSPLGELFDHGCDAISIVCIIIGTCIGLQLGVTPRLMVFECFSTMFLFYAAHWQAYCSGKLKFGLIDVTEAQISIILLYIISAIFGSTFWATELPWLGVQLKMLPIGYSIFGAILACYSNFHVILMQGGTGKNGSTIAGTSVLSPLIPIGILIVMGVMIWSKSVTNVFQENVVLFILSFGMAASKVTNKLVVAHMSCTEIDLLDTSLIGPGLLFLNQYFDTFFNEFTVLILCFIFCTADLFYYSIVVCRQMSDYLKISIFSIDPAGPAAPVTKRVQKKPGELLQNNSRPSGHPGGDTAVGYNTHSSHSRSSSSSSCDTRPMTRSSRSGHHCS